jgi:hypothetical protein
MNHFMISKVFNYFFLNLQLVSNTLVQGWPTTPASLLHFRRQQLARALHLTLKFMKSKYRLVLADDRITELLQTALTAYQPKLTAYPEL